MRISLTLNWAFLSSISIYLCWSGCVVVFRPPSPLPPPPNVASALKPIKILMKEYYMSAEMVFVVELHHQLHYTSVDFILVP